MKICIGTGANGSKTSFMASLSKHAKRWSGSMFRLRSMLVAVLLVAVLPATAKALDVKTLPAPKGAEIWYVPDHTLPMIAVSVALPAGSAFDPPGKAGLANFAAHLLDEGAGRLKADAFQTALGNRAIRLSVTTDRDFLIVSLVTLADNAKDAFDLLGQALAHPRFDASAIGLVRAQILADISEEDAKPGQIARKALFRAWFHDGPYAHPIIGDAASVGAISAGDLKHFDAAHWVSRGLKIAIAGDVDEAALPALIQSAFGELAATAPRQPVFDGRSGGAALSTIDMAAPQSQSVAAFALPGLLRSDPQYLPAFIANCILGGGFASRLAGELHEKCGLTCDESTSLKSWRKAGLVLGEVTTTRSAMKQTISALRDTLRDFAQNGPTDTELADAKAWLTGSWPLSFSSNVDIADQLNTFQRAGLTVDYIRNRNALINAVTSDQVKRVAHRLFNPAKLAIVVAGGLGRSQAGGKTGETAAMP
ncbi:MAG: M16 family metallopeptidase [Rhizomicrobium sp.]